MEDRTEEGRAGLPYAFGQRFHTLDEYLVHLERRAGPIDLPWWRRIGPDQFERVRGKAARTGERQLATRAELMQRFGFRR